MSTPTKKRKTNNYKPSSQTAGSLDFFFGKQKANQSSSTLAQDGANHAIEQLTDEELARKLQNEWDEQDRVQNGVEAEVSEKTETGVRHDSIEDQKVSEEVYPEIENLPARTRNGSNGVTALDRDQDLNKVKKDTLSLQSTASAQDNISSTVPFDENPLTFDPKKYLPDLRKNWAELGGDATYGILTRCFILVNSTQSRIKIVDTLVNFLRLLIEGDHENLLPAVSGLIHVPLRR